MTDRKAGRRAVFFPIRYAMTVRHEGGRVRFRYKLEGHDTEWQEPGTRRQAFYNDLRPGKYKFRVIACNDDGVWNEEGATLDFSVAPTWYETIWFRAACVGGFVLLLWALSQLRLQQLHRQFNMTLEARVDERTRIARELHDTLLQSFNALLLRLQAVSNVLPAQPEVARERVNSAIEQASAAITEGRDAVLDCAPAYCRPSTLFSQSAAL